MVAHETLMDAELACGRAAELIPELEALRAEHPTRESFQAQLMLALYRSGRHTDALRSFQDHRRTLAEELGLDPTPSLQELERRILSHDPSLLLDQPAGQPLRGYRLGERLGTGRDGTVHAARLPGVDRELAIRVLHQELADDPEFVRTFEATAHRVASLRHPAIVALQDYWREPGAAYVVMRRLHGGTLTDRLARGALTTSEVATLVSRVGGALVTAAAAGVVHGSRDGRQRALRRFRRAVPRRLRRRARARPCGRRCPRLRRDDPALCRRGQRRRRRPGRRHRHGRAPGDGRPGPRADRGPDLRPRRRPRAAPEPVQGPAGLRRERRRRLLRAARPDRGGPRSAPPGRSRRPARARGRRLRHREVECGAGRPAAARAGRRGGRLRRVVRDDDAPGRLALRRAGREPPSGRRRRDDGPGRRPGCGHRRHRPRPARPRPPGRPAAAGHRPVRGALHVRVGTGPAGLPGRPGARHVGARQPPAGRGHPAGRLLRPATRGAGLRCPRERRHGRDRGDDAGRARGGHRRAGRAGGPSASSGRWSPSSWARSRTSRPPCPPSSSPSTSWRRAATRPSPSRPITGSVGSTAPSPGGPSSCTSPWTNGNRSRSGACSSTSW